MTWPASIVQPVQNILIGTRFTYRWIKISNWFAIGYATKTISLHKVVWTLRKRKTLSIESYHFTTPDHTYTLPATATATAKHNNKPIRFWSQSMAPNWINCLSLFIIHMQNYRKLAAPAFVRETIIKQNHVCLD